MDNAVQHDQRIGNRYLGIGWLLAILNILGIGWAIYVPIALTHYQEDVLFTLDGAVTYALQMVASVGAVGIFALLQILFLGKVARGMVADVPEVAAAETALRLARWVAVITVVVCIVSIFVSLKLYRRWDDVLRITGG
ncbi:MAG: hypothetical protein ACR2HJ_07380 [Fimbriimonadales bacterium]